MTEKMDTRSQAKSKSKRQCDNEDSGQRKSQRLASTAETEQKKKIIDLNDDCLMKVFGYLDLQCLFNVAVANEWLRPAARNVYTRKFGGKSVIISGCDDFHPNTRANARIVESKTSVVKECCNQINVIGLKPSLLYLRCFGPAITDLRIDYDNSESKRYNHVHQYINDYGFESLTRIRFDRMPNIGIDQFRKVFVRVEDVDILGNVLGVQWSNTFVNCFPNLRRLEMWYVNMARSDGLTKSFEHLEHLEIMCCNESTTIQLAAGLLRGAHQLKSMKIYKSGEHKLPIETFLDMIKDKPLLTQVRYDAWQMQDRTIPVNSVAAQRIINDLPAVVELGLSRFQFSLDDINAFIGQLNSLKTFRLAMRQEDYRVLKVQLENEWAISSWGAFNFNGQISIVGSFHRIEQ